MSACEGCLADNQSIQNLQIQDGSKDAQMQLLMHPVQLQTYFLQKIFFLKQPRISLRLIFHLCKLPHCARNQVDVMPYTLRLFQAGSMFHRGFFF